MINKSQLTHLRTILDGKDIKRLSLSSQKAQQVERKFNIKTNRLYSEIEEKLEKELLTTGKIPTDFDFSELFMEHQFETQIEAVKITRKDIELHHNSTGSPPKKKKLAKKTKKKVSKKAPSRGKIVPNYAELLEQYDNYRKKKKPTARVKQITADLQKEYVKKCQEVFKKYSKEFRSGDIQEKKDIIDRVKKAGRTTQSRAKTIVQTETTYYYNKTREAVYNESKDVTHYLFVTIRDMATTKWCKTRRGLVYKKGSKYLKDELPPIHWNCRSEILPLTMANPKHRALILNSSLARENNKCEPLPKGWKGR